jgi:hypothetical protein
LLRKSRTEHIVILTIDHVCTDATGLAVLWNDLERCYVARKQAAIPRLPELAFQAQDVEVWQRQLVFGPDGAKQIAYWRTKLRGCLPCLLPTDHPRPQGDAGAALRAVACSLVSVSIPKAKASSVFELARENKASVYAVLLAHLGPVLGRWLGQDEVSVLSTYHHRDRPGTEQLVSLLGNSLLMRLELSGSPSRSELIARAMSTTFEAFSNAFAPVLSLPREQQDLPFREPLAPMDAFRINFNYLLDKAPTASRFADLEREQLPILPTKSRFDLIVIVHGTPEDLRISGMYNSDLFRRETIERLLAEYVQAIS